MNSQYISKPLVWFSGEVKTPPFSTGARIEAGVLLRRLQEGEILSLPVSRPMPSISAHCHELRINDNETDKQWRIIYRIDPDAIVIVDVFQKSTQKTPKRVINNCHKRLRLYDEISKET
ncbi:MAG: type II toxin-antitoxin system RelE/ParE family toxin [Tolypothrix brevis GSE-NOS-MK-07-07A]|jgi:phage-related protein|nr:type II toxin-antitoxin system RelE/ParE family toxin [Tolypothrix brevis GSE-NOS-MK-07-07A]